VDEVARLMRGLDRPKPLRVEARVRIRSALVNNALVNKALGDDVLGDNGLGDEVAVMVAGVDAPSPLPSGTRARVLSRLAAERRTPQARCRRRASSMPRWLAAAAAVVLAGALTTVVARNGGSHSRVSIARPHPLTPGAPPAEGGVGAEGVAAGGGIGGPASGTAGSGAAAGPAAVPPAFGASGAGGGASSGAPGAGPPPPFAYPGAPPATSSEGRASNGPQAGAAPAGSLTVDVVGGDKQEEAGFRAYLDLLDRSGGVRGHQLIQATGARNAIATANLSGEGLTTPPPAAPLLETLAVSESELRGSVFDLASAPVHQARLAVAAVFPSSAPGKVAAVYRASTGVLATEVPDALAAALRERGVVPVVTTYVPGAQSFVRADAAFLSLNGPDASSWFADARQAGYQPPLGTTGLYSAAEPAAARSAPDGTQALAPYLLQDDDETRALAQGIGGSPGMAAVHGWVTAKVLAVAIWRSGATNGPALTAALRALQGYADGFAPPLAWRPNSTSRMPDAVLYTVQNGSLVPHGGFQTDT